MSTPNPFQKTLRNSFRNTLGITFILSTLLPVSVAFAEPQNIAFTEENWSLIADAGFEQVDGRTALRLGASSAEKPFSFGVAVLNEVFLHNGTIEYDLKVGATRTFSGIRFRSVSQGDSEDFYIRAHQSGKPDASQYMPNYNGVASWQLYSSVAYTASTQFAVNEWMRIKLVVQDGIADIYVGDQMAPELTVALKREPTIGAVALWGLDLGGASWISNFSIDVASSEEIVGTLVSEPAATSGTVMSWNVSNAVDGVALAGQATLSADMLDGLTFTAMVVESTGLLNLAQLQGIVPGADTALAKITITSDSAQLKAFEFGFSDDATVFLNGNAVVSGSDRLNSRDFRFLGTVGYYDTAWLSLEEGENELVIMVTENPADPTGWAVQGRFKDMAGLTINN